MNYQKTWKDYQQSTIAINNLNKNIIPALALTFYIIMMIIANLSDYAINR